MIEYVLIDHLKRRDISACYGNGPALTPTCAVKLAKDGRRAVARHINAPATEVLTWLRSLGVAPRRTSVYRHTFDLDPNQEIEFRLRWG